MGEEAKDNKLPTTSAMRLAHSRCPPIATISALSGYVSDMLHERIGRSTREFTSLICATSGYWPTASFPLQLLVCNLHLSAVEEALSLRISMPDQVRHACWPERGAGYSTPAFHPSHKNLLRQLAHPSPRIRKAPNHAYHWYVATRGHIPEGAIP